MIQKILKSYILYSFGFVLSLYLHKRTILHRSVYELIYVAFITAWAVSSILTRKFKKQKVDKLLNKLYTYVVSFFLMMGILALIIYVYDLRDISRFVILSSLIISFSIEISYLLYKNKEKINFTHINFIYSTKEFTFEVLIFGIIDFYLINKLEGSLFFNSQSVVLFFNLYLSWLAGSFVGHQFHPRYTNKNYMLFMWQYIKSYIMILALSSFSGFINQLGINDIMIIVYGVIVYSLLSFTTVSLFYYVKKHRVLTLKLADFPVKGESGDILLDEKVANAKTFYRSSFNRNDSEFVHTKFKNFSLFKYPSVYEFLDGSIDLTSFDYSSSVILKSNDISNIDYFPDGELQFLLNLQKLNHIRNFNKYLAEVNSKLMNDGIFAGNFETNYLRHQKYLKEYPYYFAQMLFFFDFLWNRVFAKITILKTLYIIFSGGKRNALSLAEGLGRLYFSGFEVLNLKIIGDNMFFIAKKKTEPLQCSLPSSGLLFKMRRMGKDGQPVFIYKIRTMHPYAEYVQEFIYEKFNLQIGGKFKNDFRITYWGSILRKLWIDELPMLYNWLRGDLKLVGPRPLSQHYFNLYSLELKQKRLKYKPGLIPPFYADNPKTLNEIMESEVRYLTLYEKNHIKTDIKYFIKCVGNILFKGARSG
jgi:lipopolysaccharide/colanic/teichoic acid biosynthesis glycosyltransferase